MGDCIDFANAIIKKTKKYIGEPIVYYSLSKYKNMGSFDIFTDISEHFTLVKLMSYSVNVNHAISVLGYWIFDANYGNH